MTDVSVTSSGRSSGSRLPFSWADVVDTLKRGDIALGVGVMMIIVVLVFPMPAWLLDLLLAFSIITSVLILMTALFIREPLEFSSFPTVLLISTLFGWR